MFIVGIFWKDIWPALWINDKLCFPFTKNEKLSVKARILNVGFSNQVGSYFALETQTSDSHL